MDLNSLKKIAEQTRQSVVETVNVVTEATCMNPEEEVVNEDAHPLEQKLAEINALYNNITDSQTMQTNMLQQIKKLIGEYQEALQPVVAQLKAQQEADAAEADAPDKNDSDQG